MKKILKVVCAIVVILIILSVVFGGGSSDTSTKEITPADTSTEETDTTASDSESDTGEKEISEAETDSGITIEEQVLLEQDGIKITAKGYETDSIWGDGISLLIENDTDKNVGVGCNALIVNDYMITDLFSTTVAAGKKANETLSLSSGELEAAGISNVGQIEVYFHLFDGDSYDTMFDADRVVIETSAFDSMDEEAEVEGEELYNQDGIRIVGKYVDENSFWGAAVLLYIENTSGRNVGVSCDNMSINGFMVTPYFSCTVYDQKKSIDDITILSTDLEDNGITSVEDLEVNFHIYDADSYDTICDTGAIAFKAQ